MLPQGFPERMLHLLGEAEFAEFLASYERPRSAGLRLNPRKPLPDGASLPFCEAQVPWEPNGYYVCEGSRPGLHPWHDAGAYYLQEPSAMAPARLLDAQPGERVLDLCAAPGGKTTQLAAAMQGMACSFAMRSIRAARRCSPQTSSGSAFRTPLCSASIRQSWPSASPAILTASLSTLPAPARACSGRRRPP